MKLEQSRIFWDFDGTLAWLELNWADLAVEAAEQLGHDLSVNTDYLPRLAANYSREFPPTLYRESHAKLFAGRSWWQFTIDLLTRTIHQTARELAIPLSRDEAAACARLVKNIFLTDFRYHLFSDTLPALQLAGRHGARQYILSNHIPELRQIITSLRIEHYFCAVFNSADIGYEKPNQAIFSYALNHSSPERHAIMIGDNPLADRDGARSCGIEAILLNRNTDGQGALWAVNRLID